MACRLINLCTQPLRVDLRGGGELLLRPGERSAALREELLYDNLHIAQWERAGWLLREPARMSDVRAREEGGAGACSGPGAGCTCTCTCARTCACRAGRA